MKAIVYRNYGSPDVLHYEDVAKPVPAANEVLVKVHAASVNPYDWHFMRGDPYIVRIFAGLFKPKFPILGADMAGVVEAVGASVTQFQPGDEVFGNGRGAFAEYVCVTETSVMSKPGGISFEQVASVPIAGLTALQSLRDKGHIRSGCKVLINGAAGGVGTFAVQIAKTFGADVTGVCSTRNVEMVRALHADHVIDYTQENFNENSQRYDIFLDLVGNHPLSACRRILTPHGIYVAAGGKADPWMFGVFAQAIHAFLLSLTGTRKLVGFFAKMNQGDLKILSELIQVGEVLPVLDKTYSLRDCAAAVRYVEEGHARGKVVIVV
jgi:NADPH:quinone reductase-like Zn-dependent oxidoreductase